MKATSEYHVYKFTTDDALLEVRHDLPSQFVAVSIDGHEALTFKGLLVVTEDIAATLARQAYKRHGQRLAEAAVRAAATPAANAKPCEECTGSGKIHNAPCVRCNGKGWLPI